MFLSGMKEAEAAEIVVEDVRMPAFRRLLAFLYTGNCSFNQVRRAPPLQCRVCVCVV